MDIYTNSVPLLISERVSGTYKKLLNDMTTQNTSLFRKIYDDYVHPNIGVCLIISLIVIFLIWRYVSVRKNREKFGQNIIRREIADDNYNGFSGMDDPNERIARPILNPSVPINRQTSYVNYLPDSIPVINNGQFINNIQEHQYDAPPIMEGKYQYSGTYYKGGENGVSDDMENPFVEYGKQNLIDYNDIIGDKINIGPHDL